jgi:hypothetical protein
VLIGFFGWSKFGIPEDILFWAVVVLVGPVLVWGFVPIKGMTLERFIQVYVQYMTNSGRRIYEYSDTVYFNVLHEQICEAEIRQERIDNGEIFDDEDDEDDDSE